MKAHLEYNLAITGVGFFAGVVVGELLSRKREAVADIE